MYTVCIYLFNCKSGSHQSKLNLSCLTYVPCVMEPVLFFCKLINHLSNIRTKQSTFGYICHGPYAETSARNPRLLHNKLCWRREYSTIWIGIWNLEKEQRPNTIFYRMKSAFVNKMQVTGNYACKMLWQ